MNNLNSLALEEYAKKAEREGMTKRLRAGEYRIAKNGVIIVCYDRGLRTEYEALAPLGYSWEGCKGGGVHGWHEPLLAWAREYKASNAIRCVDSYLPDDEELKDMEGCCLWGDWAHDPENHHPIELMDDPYNTFGDFNPFFS